MRTLVEHFPHETFVYLGDTARVPYGSRDKETIIEFSTQLVDFLNGYNPKCYVVACNTISATCLDIIKNHATVPVIDVIRPTVRYAVQRTKTKKIGVLGTRATISSNIYENKIREIDAEISVISQACPLFMPLVEEGLIENPATKEIAANYLKSLQDQEVDTVILGCTHYPLLRHVISGIMGDNVMLVDSALPTSLRLEEELKKDALLTDEKSRNISFLFTDISPQVAEIAANFFGHSLSSQIQKVSVTHPIEQNT